MAGLAISEQWDDDVLDEMVHNTTQENSLSDLNSLEEDSDQEGHISDRESDASIINNGGIDDQVDFLLKSGHTLDAIIAIGRGK